MSKYSRSVPRRRLRGRGLHRLWGPGLRTTTRETNYLVRGVSKGALGGRAEWVLKCEREGGRVLQERDLELCRPWRVERGGVCPDRTGGGGFRA